MTADGLGRIRWRAGAIGSYEIELQVADGRGGTVTQAYQLQVLGDEAAPQVDLGFSSNVVEIGETLA
jgi:hypothetical protein